MIRALLASFAFFILCGFTSCATLGTVLPARTAIPIECKEPIPARPVMPTEGLDAGASADAYVQAAAAEIDFREGYEGELRTSLLACTAPIKQ